jgi:hypothetical protein
MPNFKKSDGFSLGGNPFTMKKGSKEINTEGSFRKEATDKMGGYGSPLFAIAGREGRGAGAAYEDTTTNMAADVDAAMSEGKEVAGALGLGGEEESPTDESVQTLSSETESKASDAFKNSDTMANTKLTEGIIKQ